MPKRVIESAERTLHQLENTGDSCEGASGCLEKSDCKEEKRGKKRGRKGDDDGLQLSFYQLDDPLLLDLKMIL